jgi:hypothetical protein
LSWQANDERAEPAREELDAFYDACEKANRVKLQD